MSVSEEADGAVGREWRDHRVGHDLVRYEVQARHVGDRSAGVRGDVTTEFVGGRVDGGDVERHGSDSTRWCDPTGQVGELQLQCGVATDALFGDRAQSLCGTGSGVGHTDGFGGHESGTAGEVAVDVGDQVGTSIDVEADFAVG